MRLHYTLEFSTSKTGIEYLIHFIAGSKRKTLNVIMKKVNLLVELIL